MPVNFSAKAIPSPAPHLRQMNEPLPPLLSKVKRSVPALQMGQGPALPLRNDSGTPRRFNTPFHFPCAASLVFT